MNKTKFIALLVGLISFSFTPLDIDLKSFWNKLLNLENFQTNIQSFCFEENGQIYGENIDTKVNPASVSKIYTTLWSLDELSSHFRFQTKIVIKNKDLYFIGGGDPFFVSENLFLIMNQLALSGFTSFDTIHFSEDFFLNWSDSKEKISSSLMNIMNTSRWDNRTVKTFTEMNSYIKSNQLGDQIILPKMSANRVLATSRIRMMSEDYSFYHKSSPLWQHLKQVNMYSNNFYSDKIFSFLGGSQEFSNYIYKKISATKDDIYFYTGSGLGKNYTTCRTTLTMLSALEEALRLEQLQIQDLMAVAGVDKGTLQNRFQELTYRAKVLAKTGTLNNTSTLAGYLWATKSVKFGIFNSTHKTNIARKLQDKFVKKAIDNLTNIQQIQYSAKDYLSIHDVEILMP